MEIFGLWELPTMLNQINKLLAPHGLKLKLRRNYREWGDQVLVTVERSNKRVKPTSATRRASKAKAR